MGLERVGCSCDSVVIVLGDCVGKVTGEVGCRLWLGMDCCGTMFERTYEVAGVVLECLDVVL